MIIYNLAKYIRTQLPILKVVTNGWQLGSPKEAINLVDNGGTPDKQLTREDPIIQVLSRGRTSFKAYINIYSVYALLKNRFHLTLPEAIVDDVTFPEVIAYRICPLQIPGNIGMDDKNLYEWSYNMVITIN
jgi:hypothetical protein